MANYPYLAAVPPAKAPYVYGVPDLDSMFRMYDRKFSDIYGKSGMARKMEILRKCAESLTEFRRYLKRMR